ncbi:MAG TPA: histidine kinase, partial [Longimicrobium sp.]|nr:histidine kinase [Longimicrobium sp.]
MAQPQPPTPSPAPPLRRPWLKWAAAGVFAWWLVLGVVSSVQFTLMREWNELPFSLGLVLTVAAYDTLTWTPLSIAAFWLAHRLPLENGGWRRSLPLLVGVAVVLVFLKSVVDYQAYKQWEFWIGSQPSFMQVIVSRLPRHLMMFSLLVGIGYGVDYFVRFRDRQLAASRLETELARAHLHALETQLQPHFLFNTLHAIATLLHVDPPAAERMLTSLSELLRASLAAQSRQEVPLADEMELLQAYVDIEQVRFGDRLHVDMDVAPDARPAHVPHLLLQPLVENAVRHGIEPSTTGGTIRVRTQARLGQAFVRID